MSSNRIRCSNIQVGDSLVVGQAGADALFKPEEKAKKAREKDVQEMVEKKLAKTSEQAALILKEAQKKADALVEQAELKLKQADEEAAKKAEETEQLRQQTLADAHQEGLQQGIEEGIAQSKQEIAQKVWGIETLCSASFQVKKEIVDSAEKEIIELATTIAEKILHQQLEIKPEQMQEIIKSAISQLKDKEEIKIIINPAVTQNLYDFAEELKETVRGLKTIKITEDMTIPQDGVIVESPDSRIDGRIETQIEEIVKNVMLEFSQKTINEDIPNELSVLIDEKKAQAESSELEE